MSPYERNEEFIVLLADALLYPRRIGKLGKLPDAVVVELRATKVADSAVFGSSRPRNCYFLNGKFT